MTDRTRANRKPKLCFVVSAPMTAVSFLNGHIDHLTDDFDITVACKFDGSESRISNSAELMNIRITRQISPLMDSMAIWKLYRFLRQEKFDIVHSVSPKAGLVSAVSAWLARTPIRIHWFTGQVWVLSKGLKRVLLKNLDRLIYRLNTRVLVDSPSQRDFLIHQDVITASRSQVLGSGSIAGVDTARFRPDLVRRATIREELRIGPASKKVIIYIGRLTQDKGIDILLEVFQSASLHEDPYLVLVGPDEGSYLSKFSTLDREHIARFRYIPYTQNPEYYLAAADIFCLPTFREGFGLSIIEASAVGLPVVASNIYGVADAVEDQLTGILIGPGDSAELATSLNRLLSNPDEVNLMGTLGRRRVLRHWQARDLQVDLEHFYRSQIRSFLEQSVRDGSN